jgi:hypothetical protein
MNYFHVKIEHYEKFVEKYKTDRLCKNLKLFCNSKSGFLITENFNNPIETYL